MSAGGPAGGGGGPEGGGGPGGLRPERLGAGGGGWTLDEQGTTMGRIFRFATAEEMRAFVGDLQEALGALAEARSADAADGPVTLMVFLAGHRSGGRR